MADTLAELDSMHPGTDLMLVVGSDIAQGLDTWKRPAELRELSTTVVVDRAGRAGGRPPLRWPAMVVEGRARRLVLRHPGRFADGRPVEALVPRAVADVVRARGLYGCGR